jgi:hypothetical protein
MVTGALDRNDALRIILGHGTVKTILHKKCRSGKNSEDPAENSWALDLCPAK